MCAASKTQPQSQKIWNIGKVTEEWKGFSPKATYCSSNNGWAKLWGRPYQFTLNWFGVNIMWRCGTHKISHTSFIIPPAVVPQPYTGNFRLVVCRVKPKSAHVPLRTLINIRSEYIISACSGFAAIQFANEDLWSMEEPYRYHLWLCQIWISYHCNMLICACANIDLTTNLKFPVAALSSLCKLVRWVSLMLIFPSVSSQSLLSVVSQCLLSVCRSVTLSHLPACLHSPIIWLSLQLSVFVFASNCLSSCLFVFASNYISSCPLVCVHVCLQLPLQLSVFVFASNYLSSCLSVLGLSLPAFCHSSLPACLSYQSAV